MSLSNGDASFAQEKRDANNKARARGLAERTS